MVGELAFRAFLPRTFNASRDARHDLEAWLPPRCAPSTAEAALLLVSELVTNAVVHTRSADIAVRARCNAETLVVAVDDQEPRAADPGSGAEVSTGAGLTLVDSLASRWGWEPLANGKRVWFEISCTGGDDCGTSDGSRSTAVVLDLRDTSRV